MEYRGSLKLSVLDDFMVTPVVITHKELDVGAEITVRIEYLGNEYSGNGKSLEWTDAFANLQKALPDGVKIQSCMTCKYGTLCPYGNIPNYVLCSQNTKTNSKDDVIAWLAAVDVKTVEKSALDCCDAFEYANQNDYTYNDYFYYLQK